MSSLTICLVALAGLGAGPPRLALRPVPLAVSEGMAFDALALSPDGASLAAVCQPNPKLKYHACLVRWSTDTGKELARSGIVRKSFAALTYTHDGKWIVGLAPRSSDQLCTWGPECRPAGDAYMFQFDPFSERIFGTADGRVMWCGHGEMGGCEARPKDGRGHNSFRRVTRVLGMYSGAVSPDGRLWAHLNHQDIDLYVIKARKRERSLLGVRGRVRSVAFRPDGERLASVSHWQDDRRTSHSLVTVWGVADGKRHLAVELTPGLEPAGVALSSTGLVAVVGGARDYSTLLRVLDAEGAEVARSSFPLELGGAREVAFSRDGKYLAVCFVKGVRLWKVKEKERP
jgi:hypothetical protein